MTKEELWQKFAPRRCGSQVEYDNLMNEIRRSQEIANHPHLDRLRELDMQRTLIMQQGQALRVQLSTIKVERLEIERKRKDTNRMYHALKHELTDLNPKGLKNEQRAQEAQG